MARAIEGPGSTVEEVDGSSTELRPHPPALFHSIRARREESRTSAPLTARVTDPGNVGRQKDRATTEMLTALPRPAAEDCEPDSCKKRNCRRRLQCQQRVVAEEKAMVSVILWT